jgi:hypothetical protein
MGGPPFPLPPDQLVALLSIVGRVVQRSTSCCMLLPTLDEVTRRLYAASLLSKLVSLSCSFRFLKCSQFPAFRKGHGWGWQRRGDQSKQVSIRRECVKVELRDRVSTATFGRWEKERIEAKVVWLGRRARDVKGSARTTKRRTRRVYL